MAAHIFMGISAAGIVFMAFVLFQFLREMRAGRNGQLPASLQPLANGRTNRIMDFRVSRAALR
jgi:hypothetical protein